MDWVKQLNAALEYIEANLTGNIDYSAAAQIACCSPYHFQRMFSYIVGVPLGEYIRRRRMTQAAADLRLQSTEKIIDIALKYGYDSPTAFNRAFQSIHGVAPSKVRSEKVTLKAYPPISFKITITGDVEMDYRIEQKDAFQIVGVASPLTSNIEENFAAVPQMWQKAATENIIPRLTALMGDEPQGVLGVSCCNDAEEWQYFIAVAGENTPDTDFATYQVPAATWAIFPGSGSMPHSIQELEKRVITEWLPNSGYEYANAPDIEVYLSPDPANAVFEVWVPVKAKS